MVPSSDAISFTQLLLNLVIDKRSFGFGISVHVQCKRIVWYLIQMASCERAFRTGFGLGGNMLELTAAIPIQQNGGPKRKGGGT